MSKEDNFQTKFDIGASIEYNKYHAEKYLADWLNQNSNFNKSTKQRILKDVDDKTMKIMNERFSYPLIQNNSEFKKINININENSVVEQQIIDKLFGYDDWRSTVSIVPFYQSLGDTIGYYNGNWEFNYNNIHAGPEYVNELIYDFIKMGGINNLSIKNWVASDDTILYLDTLNVTLTSVPIFSVENDIPAYNETFQDIMKDIDSFGSKMRDAYLESKSLLENRSPGRITVSALEIQQNIAWNQLPYNRDDIGNGSAMRSGGIGLILPGKLNRNRLIAYAVESSRITHNSATAILGSITSALFTAYSVEKIPINQWPHKLLKLLESNRIDEYMEISRPNEAKLYTRDKTIFIGKWKAYVREFFAGSNPRTDLRYMDNLVMRYKSLYEKFSKGYDIAGAGADDSVIMAYDSLLRSEGVIEKLIFLSILHPGDSDTVGSIAFSWFGGYYHSPRNYQLIDYRFNQLEFYDRLFHLQKAINYALPKIYFYDIYITIGLQYMKRYL